jgi:hypothetical protein
VVGGVVAGGAVLGAVEVGVVELAAVDVVVAVVGPAGVVVTAVWCVESPHPAARTVAPTKTTMARHLPPVQVPMAQHGTTEARRA